MWKLTLAELNYRRVILLILIAVSLFLTLRGVDFSGNYQLPKTNQGADLPFNILLLAMAPVALIMLLPSLIAAVIFLRGEKQEHRGRLLNSLPLRQAQVSLFRLMFPALLVGFNLLLPLFLMTRLRLDGHAIPLSIPLSVAGLLLFMLMLVLWQREISVGRSRLPARLAVAAVIVVIILCLQSHTLIHYLLLSGYGTLSLYVAALILALTVHRLYLRRSQVYRDFPGV
jgi:hypothetical protein